MTSVSAFARACFSSVEKTPSTSLTLTKGISFSKVSGLMTDAGPTAQRISFRTLVFFNPSGKLGRDHHVLNDGFLLGARRLPMKRVTAQRVVTLGRTICTRIAREVSYPRASSLRPTKMLVCAPLTSPTPFARDRSAHSCPRHRRGSWIREQGACG